MTASGSLRVSVVGASGFIGRWLVRELEGLEWALDRFDRSRPAVVRGSIDHAVLKSDVVYWLASRTNPAVAAEDPQLAEDEYAEFSEFVSLMTRSNASALVVIVSSGGTVYASDTEPPYAETAPLRDSHPYATLKIRMETRIAMSPLRHCIVRLSNPYGPGQPAGRRQGVVGEWTRSISLQRPIRVIGSLDARRDFLYVEDAATGLAAVAMNNIEGVINIGSGVGTSLRAVLDHLQEISPHEVVVEYEAGRRFDVMSTWLSIDKMLTASDWRPTVPLRVGLERTLKYQLASTERV